MMNTALAKLALTVGGSDKGRKTIAWILAAVLSPLILITAVLCSLASGGAEHNKRASTDRTTRRKYHQNFALMSPRCGKLFLFWIRR